jgi:hypothetical protein
LHLPALPPEVVHEPALPALHASSAPHLHARLLHEKPDGQACPQPPQFALSLPSEKHPAGLWQQV